MPTRKLEARVVTYSGKDYKGAFLPGESLQTVFEIINPMESCLPETTRRLLERFDTYGLTTNGRQVGLTIQDSHKPKR